MKYQFILITIFFASVSFNNTSAQNSIDHYLSSVKVNNKTLQTATNYNKVQKAELKTGIAPKNPEFELGYFPGNSSEIGTKQTIGISQSFEFPSTYVYKNKIANTQQSIANLEFQKVENQLLFEASKAWQTAVFLNKLADNYAKRNADAKQLVDFYKKKQKNGDATQLEVNKAKLFLLTIQNEQRLNLSRQKKNNQYIKELNGGEAYQVTNSEFHTSNLEQWSEIQVEMDSLLPAFKIAALNNENAALNLKLNKSAWLPNLMVGYESENILGAKYSGVKAGISIPLWESSNTIKKAKAEIISTQSANDELVLEYNSWYYSNYIEAETLKQNLDEFKIQLDEMNNEYLLSRSLELGQISSIQYFMELDYFYDILDAFFQLELQYHISLTELYKYRL